MLSKEKAKEVTEYMHNNLRVEESKALDPFFIIVVAEIILQIMKVIYAKKHPAKDGLAIIQKPGILQRWTARRIIRKNLGSKYSDLYSDVRIALYEKAKTLTESDMTYLYNEVKND
jgi:hypothetical protein